MIVSLGREMSILVPKYDVPSGSVLLIIEILHPEQTGHHVLDYHTQHRNKHPHSNAQFIIQLPE